MATVRLVDVFQPTVYGTYGSLDNPILLAFLNAGVLRADGVLDGFANGPSQLATVPYWNDLDTASEPNASTDNPDDVAVPQKITSALWIARKAELNNAHNAQANRRQTALLLDVPILSRTRANGWHWVR